MASNPELLVTSVTVLVLSHYYRLYSHYIVVIFFFFTYRKPTSYIMRTLNIFCMNFFFLTLPALREDQTPYFSCNLFSVTRLLTTLKLSCTFAFCVRTWCQQNRVRDGDFKINCFITFSHIVRVHFVFFKKKSIWLIC